MLMRNVSAPASNSLPIISGLPEAGPSVATILVLRRRLIGLTVPYLPLKGGGRRAQRVGWGSMIELRDSCVVDPHPNPYRMDTFLSLKP